MNAKKSDMAKLMASLQQKYTSADEKEGKQVQREKCPAAGERQWQGSSASYPQAGQLTSVPERQFLGCDFGSQSN